MMKMELNPIFADYGVSKFDVKDEYMVHIFGHIQYVNRFLEFNYEQALEMYAKLPKDIQECIYITTSIDTFIYYDSKFKLVSISNYLLQDAEAIVKLIEQFKDITDAETALAICPKIYMPMLFRCMDEQNLIPKNMRRELISQVYSVGEYFFDTELYYNVFSETKFGAIDLFQLYKEHNLTNESLLTIYRGEDTKSTSYENSLSWTLDINTAKFFYKRFSQKGEHLYTAKVKAKNVLAYIDGRSESEVLVSYTDLIDVEELNMEEATNEI